MAKTIEQLEGHSWGDPPELESNVVKTAHRLRRKPTDQFGVEDLRFMLGQNIGTQYLMPRALGLLEQNPLVGDYHYPGEVLSSMMSLPEAYWTEHPEHLARAIGVVTKAQGELDRRKAERAARPAFRPDESPNGSDSTERQLRKEIDSFLSSHRVA